MGKRLFTFIGLILSIAACDNTGQLTGMYNLAFNSTAVCNGQQKTIQFKNTGDQPIVIAGANISYGTDAEGNFSLTSATVGSTNIESSSDGSVNDLTVPPGTNYSFNVTYTPRTPNTTNSALLDIAYTAPKQGIVQVALLGSATGQAPNCSSSPFPQGGSGGSGSGGTNGGGLAALDGNATITINRIVLYTSAVPAPITTDSGKTTTPYQPVPVPIILNLAAKTVTLKAIPKNTFILPAPKGGALGNNVSGKTEVTTKSDASGNYQSDGSLTIPSILIHLSENFNAEQNFEADILTSLTTGSINPPAGVNNLSILRSTGFTVSSDGKSVSGSPINSNTYDVTFVGQGVFSGGSGAGNVADQITDKSGIILIQATLKPPVK